MSSAKIDLIRQALSAAESSLKLSKQLLNDLEKDGGVGKTNKPQAKELPGSSGVFDGLNMITESGEKFAVPENYASKSILVVGDTLKLVEEGGTKRFKQIEHVKRHKTTGILTKKDGKWAAVTPEGSYKILAAAIAHFGGDVGDEALLQLPASNLQVPYAAVEKITKKAADKESGDSPKAEKVESQKESKKPGEKTSKEPKNVVNKEIIEEKPEPQTKEEKKDEVKQEVKPAPEVPKPAASEPRKEEPKKEVVAQVAPITADPPVSPTKAATAPQEDELT